ncbi:alpha-aminoadipic semialdehyde synthase [Citrus sinensis]|nr:alpha-aminoadipic semialdehyde synthase [Citrus sinensis]
MPMLGNGVVGILSESVNKWERRAPLTPSHCARLLHSGRDKSGVARIVVQPSTKRIHHDVLYEDVGCQISEDLSECGLVLGIKQPKLEMILPDKAYAFFSHTHKAQRENMPLLDKILAERVSLYDYELIVGDNGRRLLAFGKFAGRAGMIDFLHGLGQRYLSLGYSTPFLSLGASYMYSSLAAAKAAVISVGEEISTLGLPSGICPLVFIFTGSGNVSLGAQEIFKLLPHTFVEPSRLPELFGKAKDQHGGASKRIFQVYGCVVTSEDMVEHKDPTKGFDKADYYAHPEHYNPVFHKKIAPYASVIVNCMYWEQRFPRLLSTQQLQDLASQHFGDILLEFIGSLSSTVDFTELPSHLRRACIAHGGALTTLYEYIPRMRKSDSEDVSDNLAKGHSNKKKHNLLVSLSGHLFDQFLINEALDIIEAAGGSFHLVKCQVGQSTEALSFSELEVGADDSAVLDQIIDSLTSLANASENNRDQISGINRISLRIGKVQETATQKGPGTKGTSSVLIIGAGRVCRPAAELLASFGSPSHQMQKTCMETDFEWQNDIRVLVASLYLKDAEEVIEGIPNAEAVQLDVSDHKSLCKCISQVEIVISLLPASCHVMVANACIELKKHLVTASYIDDSMSKLDEKAKGAGITILGEMGLDPGIDHMMAMKMINHAHVRKGKIKSFTSYCGGLPSPAAANNPLAYKFSWSPAGAIRAGRNPAIYLFNGKTIQVDGDSLYDSAEKFRIADLPAFALECLPNRNSLVANPLMVRTGFGEIMGTLGRIGFFSAEAHPVLKQGSGPTFRMFLCEILKMDSQKMGEAPLGEKEITERILSLGHCKERETASKAAKTIIFLGLHEQTEIPASCESPFSVTCLLMEEKLAYSSTEEDMVLLHHEVEVEFPDGQPSENNRATLLEFGKMKNGKMISAMALTVGIPAGIAAMLLLVNKIKTRGVLRPIEPEVYVPALDMLQAYGIKLVEKSG